MRAIASITVATYLTKSMVTIARKKYIEQASKQANKQKLYGIHYNNLYFTMKYGSHNKKHYTLQHEENTKNNMT